MRVFFFLLKILLTILFLTEICRYWLWYCKHDSPLNVSWINWFIRNKIAMWAGLNWLIKDSISLIACTVGKGTKGGEKKERHVSQRDPRLSSPVKEDASPLSGLYKALDSCQETGKSECHVSLDKIPMKTLPVLELRSLVPSCLPRYPSRRCLNTDIWALRRNKARLYHSIFSERKSTLTLSWGKRREAWDMLGWSLSCPLWKSVADTPITGDN